MKAILVVDMPNELDVNDLLIDYCVHTKGEYKRIRKGGNYSLKPMPEKITTATEPYICNNDWQNGWNDCLWEIEQ